MAWQDYVHDMQRCTRCSYCKWIPYRYMHNTDFIQGCPSISRYLWHAYAGSGKFNMAYSLQQGRIEIDDTFLDVLYKCHMDGSCDISCKVQQDIEPLQLMQELRIKCVEDGALVPAHMIVIEGLRKEDNMMMAKRADRGKWAAGLDVKDLTGGTTAEVIYHAGCAYSFDEELWPIARAGVNLLKKAGVDVGIMGADETCCGGRAYELGYAGELTKYAEHQIETFRTAGVKAVVTPCSDCYACFKVLYDKIGKKPGIEVYHITRYLDKLIKEGRLKLSKKVPLNVTYHDPCHLGRLGEPWVHWQGREIKVMGQMIVHDPPKQYRRGASGVYETPRDILKSIPGLDLVEMYRIKEYAWCCGAGGGVIDAYPDFATWTGAERLREAKAVGAEAIVSACPWCKRNFLDAAKETGDKIQVYDIIELVEMAV
ncbi:MAG: (Fe-S)-binding protein [Chloroflexota bacterium]